MEDETEVIVGCDPTDRAWIEGEIFVRPFGQSFQLPSIANWGVAFFGILQTHRIERIT
jgi:hypothetical protein